MSKGNILTCGYYSLNSALLHLNKLGYNIVKVHTMPNPVIDDFAIDESTYDNEVLMKEYVELCGDGGSRALKEKEQHLVSAFGVGGVPFSNNAYFSQIIVGSVIGAISAIKAAHKFVVDTHKKYKYKAALFHTGEGRHWRAMIETCKMLGIPTFVCLNGTVTQSVPLYSSHKLYNTADVYYLHGKYDFDWLAKRPGYITNDIVIVGQPSFDLYYEDDKVRTSEVEDVFLYCNAVVCNTFSVDNTKEHIILDMVEFAFQRRDLPTNLDGIFFLAFSKYQREVNPKAKLWVTLRPYYNLTVQEMQAYISSLGITNCEVFAHEIAPARNLIPKAKYVIGGTSTLLIEALINRKKLICLSAHKDGNFSFAKEWSLVASVSNIDNIVENLDKITKDDSDNLIEGCGKYASYYNYNDDGMAGERLAENLHERIS